MLASKIELSEPDTELTLLGSLFMTPQAFAQVAPQMQADWFSDPLARYLYEAALNVHLSGSLLSPQAVVSKLPEQCGPMTRGQLYARACGSAVPMSALGGVINTLKDRWQRRIMSLAAERILAHVGHIEVDPMSLASEALGTLDAVTSSKASRRAVQIMEGMDELRRKIADPNLARGATTGLYALDNKLNGYAPGQLYVIAGRPGMGKSAFMCSSLRRTAQSGHGVAIFSLEMSAAEISARMASDVLDSVKAPGFGDIDKGLLSDGQREEVAFAMSCFDGVPLWIEDSPTLTWAEIAARAREIKAKCEADGFPLAVVCIDHMGLVKPSDRYAGNKVMEAGEVSGAARALAKELGCCVLLLCQLSREVEKREDKRPMMSDLRWSGEIEQDAHVVAFVYRDAYYLAQDPNVMPHVIAEAKHSMEFLIRKNRNGETCDLTLWCSIQHSAVRDE